MHKCTAPTSLWVVLRYYFKRETCEKCAVPEWEIEDVVAGRLAPLMTQALRAGHHVACPRTGTTQQQGQQELEQQNGGLRPPCSMSMKHTNTTRTHPHARTCTYTHMHIHTHAHARAHTHKHARTSMHTHAHTRNRTHAKACTHTHSHTHTLTHLEANNKWYKVIIEERVGIASLSPKFEWRQGPPFFRLKVRRTQTKF